MRTSVIRRGRWALGLLMACVLILGGVGNIFQAIATRSDIEKYPAPGKLIDMGGYRLHLHCMGGSGGAGSGCMARWASSRSTASRIESLILQSTHSIRSHNS